MLNQWTKVKPQASEQTLTRGIYESLRISFLLNGDEKKRKIEWDEFSIADKRQSAEREEKKNVPRKCLNRERIREKDRENVQVRIRHQFSIIYYSLFNIKIEWKR